MTDVNSEYQKGYDAGLEAGQRTLGDSYQAGYSAGLEDGDDSRAAAYNQGYDAGHRDGYDEGYSVFSNESRKTGPPEFSEAFGSEE